MRFSIFVLCSGVFYRGKRKHRRLKKRPLFTAQTAGPERNWIREKMSQNKLIFLIRRTRNLGFLSRVKDSRASNEYSSLASRFFASKSTNHSNNYGLFGTSSLCGFRSIYKGLSFPSSRNMTTVLSQITSASAEISKEKLKLLVTKGPKAQKMIGIWLFGSAVWVFSLIVLGGITRLTRSGLSMTDWKFTGQFPPLSKEEWLLEFEKYQNSPEYKRVNKGMSVDDFKFIYWMEYAHRMWGRGLGFMFVLPCAYFLAKGYITRLLGLRLAALFTLGVGQGLVGWWMVKSGLEEPKSEYAQPRVSPYRLATHLTSAFVIYCGLLWTALSVVLPEPPTHGNNKWIHGAAKVRRLALPVAALLGVTAISGAYVAGNDAGHAYNTYPKMGDTWIPEDILSMEPLTRNFFENTATVQFDHRILATATLLSVCGLWWATRKLNLPPVIQHVISTTLGMTTLQFTLGISTLLSYVPVSLASAHQAGAMTLMTLAIVLIHTVRKPSPQLLKSLASVPK